MLGIGGLIAHVVFWVALGIGWFTEELTTRAGVIFLILWAAVYSVAAYVQQGDYLFMSFVALLDVLLLLVVLKGDIRIT